MRRGPFRPYTEQTINPLQRSRTRWSAESYPTPWVRRSEYHASTEPHSLECGEEKCVRRLPHQRSASTEPHSLECGEGLPSRSCPSTSAGFNGAALVGVRRVRSARRRCGGLRCFNGAALVGVRRVQTVHGEYVPQVDASTEPHSLECGEVLQIAQARADLAGFNGAALVGVRRAGSGAAKMGSHYKLQRSRTRWSAESRQKAGSVHKHRSASTEPHSLECGEARSRSTSATQAHCFNGAALVGVRRAVAEQASDVQHRHGFNGAALVGVRRANPSSSHAPRRQPASTEPHSLECGEQ